MNKQRRKHLDKLLAELTEIYDQITTLRDEEQDAYDAMPESFQGSDKGEAMQEGLTNLEYAADDISNAMERLSEVVTA